MASSPNPFDFSDFQSQSSGFPDSAGYGRAPVDSGFSPAEAPRQGFDPFAGGAAESDTVFRSSSDSETDRFGQVESTSSAEPFTDEVAGPPVVWCVIAGAVAVAGIVLAVLGSGKIAIAAAAWVCAGPLAIGLLAVHTTVDTKRRAKPFYSQPGWAVVVYWGVMALAMVGVVISAIRIGDWAGRL